MSDATKPLTPAERIAAANDRREAMKKTEADAYAEQQASDVEALVDLEEKHGYARVLRINVGGWKAGEGAATLVVVRLPKASESVFRRYEETVVKSKERSTATLEAAHQLADVCLIYPSKKDQKDLYDATMEFSAGIRTHIANEISKAIQGRAEEEKKG